jgi:alpha,alpha-trehalase
MTAGDRFRETYYWDSYWVLRGLLVSSMTETPALAKNTIW